MIYAFVHLSRAEKVAYPLGAAIGLVSSVSARAVVTAVGRWFV